MYVDQTGRIETDLRNIWEKTKVLHEVAQDDTSWGFRDIWEKLTSWLPGWDWLKQLFVSILVIIVLCILICLLIPCIIPCMTYQKCMFLAETVISHDIRRKILCPNVGKTRVGDVKRFKTNNRSKKRRRGNCKN